MDTLQGQHIQITPRGFILCTNLYMQEKENETKRGKSMIYRQVRKTPWTFFIHVVAMPFKQFILSLISYKMLLDTVATL